MDPIRYFDAIRERWKSILVLAVLGLVAGLAFAATRPVMYESSSSVFASAQSNSDANSLQSESTYTQAAVQSFVQLATLPKVLEPVIQELNLDTTPTALSRRVSASLELNTVIVRVTVTDEQPTRAARIADAVTASLTTAATELSADGKSKPTLVLRSVETAVPATTPSSPNVPFIGLSGLLAGLVIGIVAAVLRALLDTRIGEESDIRAIAETTPVPFLGNLSHRKRSAANVMLTDPHGPAAEEYRRLASNLEFTGIDRRLRSITVTSALPGDGKTSTAINLAAAIAERGGRVLLVDSDLRRPQLANYVGIDGGVGLSNVLLGGVSANTAIQRIGDVDVLPAGTLPPNVTQLVQSASMERLFTELLTRYDFVVVDAAPLLPVIDAVTFAKLTDGALVVARAGRTKRKPFGQAVESLELAEARIIGTALNDVRNTSGTTYRYAATNTRMVHSTSAVAEPPETFFDDDDDDSDGEPARDVMSAHR